MKFVHFFTPSQESRLAGRQMKMDLTSGLLCSANLFSLLSPIDPFVYTFLRMFQLLPWWILRYVNLHQQILEACSPQLLNLAHSSMEKGLFAFLYFWSVSWFARSNSLRDCAVYVNTHLAWKYSLHKCFGFFFCDATGLEINRLSSTHNKAGFCLLFNIDPISQFLFTAVLLY